MRALPALLLAALAQACAGGQAAQRPDPAPEATVEAEPAPEVVAAAPAAEAPPTLPSSEGAAAPSAPPPLPAKVDGGHISRSALSAVLDGGVARFLRSVQTEPHLERGRFVGWRLLSTYPREDALTPGVLAPGDTVMRVNGQSIERPEQFKNVWDAMATSSELVLEVCRGEHASTVRYTIID